MGGKGWRKGRTEQDKQGEGKEGWAGKRVTEEGRSMHSFYH